MSTNMDHRPLALRLSDPAELAEQSHGPPALMRTAAKATQTGAVAA